MEGCHDHRAIDPVISKRPRLPYSATTVVRTETEMGKFLGLAKMFHHYGPRLEHSEVVRMAKASRREASHRINARAEHTPGAEQRVLVVEPAGDGLVDQLSPADQSPQAPRRSERA